jgi:hypothetical protein
VGVGDGRRPAGFARFPSGGSEPRRMPGHVAMFRCLPSWGYVLSRRFVSMPVARHGFRAPLRHGNRRSPFRAICDPDPSVRTRGTPGLPGFAAHPPRGEWFVLRVHAPFRVSPSRPPRASVAVPRGSSARRASQGFFPYSTHRSGRSRTSPGFAAPGYGPPPGFRTLLTAYPAPIPPGLFHPGSAHGVAPFRAFFLPRSRCASRRPLPS